MRVGSLGNSKDQLKAQIFELAVGKLMQQKCTRSSPNIGPGRILSAKRTVYPNGCKATPSSLNASNL